MVQEQGLWVGQAHPSSPVLPPALTGCVTLSKPLNVSEPCLLRTKWAELAECPVHSWSPCPYRGLARHPLFFPEPGEYRGDQGSPRPLSE